MQGSPTVVAMIVNEQRSPLKSDQHPEQALRRLGVLTNDGLQLGPLRAVFQDNFSNLFSRDCPLFDKIATHSVHVLGEKGSFYMFYHLYLYTLICSPDTFMFTACQWTGDSHTIRPSSFPSTNRCTLFLFCRQDIVYVLDSPACRGVCTCPPFSLYGQCERTTFVSSLTFPHRAARINLNELPAAKGSKGRKRKAPSAQTPRQQRSAHQKAVRRRK